MCVLEHLSLLLCPHNFSDVHYDSGRQLCMPLVHRIGAHKGQVTCDVVKE